MGRRLLMIPILFGLFFILAIVGLGLLVLVSALTGDSAIGGCLVVVVMAGLFFGLIAAAIGFAFYLRKKKFGKIDDAFRWLGSPRSYMINGREFDGRIQEMDVNVRVFCRTRGHGTSIDVSVPAKTDGQWVIGTRSGLGGLLQGLTQSQEVTGVGFDQSNFALNATADSELVARSFVEYGNHRELIEALMAHESSYEIRALRFDGKRCSLQLRHPEAIVFDPDYNRVLIQKVAVLAEAVVSLTAPIERASSEPTVAGSSAKQEDSTTETDRPENEQRSVVSAEIVSQNESVITDLDFVDTKTFDELSGKRDER